jgi:predicted DCC family thiol-disulfide oxidoreductase YuxK
MLEYVVARPIVLYDGDCGVCTALKKEAQRRDAAARLRFIAYQAADLEQISPGLTREMAGRVLYLVQPDGQRFAGARAVFETMRRLPGLWRLIGAIGAFPPLSLLAEPFYRLVARNRGRISRWLGLDRCALPDPAPSTDTQGPA